MESYLALGYRTVKMKIGAVPLGQDMQRIEAVLGMLHQKYPNSDAAGNRLAVDANGRFDVETAMAYGQALEPFKLFWYEEAGDPLDFALQAELAGQYRPALATGENLFSRQDATNLIRYAGMRPDTDYLQMDPVLSYGLVEYMRMLDVLKSHGWSLRRCIPHGGYQFALHIAAGLGLGGNESYPGMFAPFGGFANTTPVENGYIGLTQVPGIGFEEKSELISLFRNLFG